MGAVGFAGGPAGFVTVPSFSAGGAAIGSGAGGLAGMAMCRQGGGSYSSRKGERNHASKPDGTPNPGKHVRRSKKHPGQWEVKDTHTGRWKEKPPGWNPNNEM